MSLPLFHQHHQPPLSPLPTYRILSPSLKPTKTLIPFPKPTKPLTRTSASISSSTNPQILPSSAIQRIADKLRTLGITTQQQTKPNPSTQTRKEPDPDKETGEIFVPLPTHLPIHRVGHTIDTSWSTPDYPIPRPGSGMAISRHLELKKEWEKEKEIERRREIRVPSLAELTLPAAELRRLRTVGIGLKKRIKVGKAGITEGIVNGIHERWRNTEVVKIACEDICRMNMKRTHDVLERKTGGLVIWRSGSKILLYRGANYQYPYFVSDGNPTYDTPSDARPASTADGVDETESTSGEEFSGPNSASKLAKPAFVQGVGSPNKVRFQTSGETQLVEEADHLLDGLGPRFTDWWGYDPLPVDGDLLPAIIPGYRRPFRLLPYGVSPKLTNDEMTTLRRLGRPLPCHFALGRNRKLQGLAAAIIKLWEKCEIAKIAVKRGVQNTNSDMMAEELKWLTGGTLIARDKDFIVLYRGKDFLPSAVSSAIEERRKHVMHMEQQTVDCNTPSKNEDELKLSDIGNRSQEEVAYVENHKSSPLSESKKLTSPEAAIERTSIKMSMALEKKAKAEKLLEELEKREIPHESNADKEGITEEERFMLRKVGLRMKAFLLLGRRGVFDGTVENMHLHWKYRELVKIICKERSSEAAHQVAQILETESGGILVAVERVSKGYAIIVYRGKNYQRPASLRPRTLLSKREAMKRSIEAQRRESLKLHVLKLSRSIDELNRELVKDNPVDGMQIKEESSFGLAKDEIQDVLVSEQESDAEIGPGHSSHQVIPSDEENVKDGNESELDSTVTNSENGMDSTTNHLETSQEDGTGLGSSCEHDSNEYGSIVDTAMTGEISCVDSSSCPDESALIGTSCSDINAEKHVFTSGKMELSAKQAEHKLPKSVPTVIDDEPNAITSRPIHLSNKERLILRKQALKMKKRPPLAVGRSNVVTGLAKAIKAHFQKYPLAIVNVKGRAQGTSVQEVVSKLLEATGALLVSQEPSKVILYRGWGAGGDEFGYGNRYTRGTINLTMESRNEATPPSVSPDLIEAIRIECGLLDHHEKETA